MCCDLSILIWHRSCQWESHNLHNYMILTHVFFCDVFLWCISEGHNFHIKHRRTSNCHGSCVSGKLISNLWNFQLSNDHTPKSIIQKSAERICRQEMYESKKQVFKIPTMQTRDSWRQSYKYYRGQTSRDFLLMFYHIGKFGHKINSASWRRG